VKRLLLSLAFVLATVPALAQEQPREAGEKLRAQLRSEPPREALVPDQPKDEPRQGDVRLAAYLGLARVGDLTFHTELEEKGGEKLYSIEDHLDIDAPGLGSVKMMVTADLAPDLSVRDWKLETENPGPAGAIVRRLLTVSPEGGALFLSESKDMEKMSKRKLEGVPLNALLLTPPLGVGERLTRLAKGAVGSRLSFDAFDVAAGKPATFALSFEEQAKTDVRGELVLLQKVSLEEGTASLECWLDPASREPVKLLRSDASAPRVTFVGREGREKRDLPATRTSEGPAETVLRFLRATGNPDAEAAQKEIEPLLDLDALYKRVTEKSPDASDPRFRKTFEKALLGRLTSDEWRKGDQVRMLAGASRPEDLAVETSGDSAKVRPKSAPEGPAFELKKTDAGWKIVAFPGG
jgi:hypothetical protein